MTYEEFLVFLDRFKQITSFAGRLQAANENLTRIGLGSGRAVYDIDGEKVLKVARNAKGIAQNEQEASAGYYRDTQHIVAKIFDSDDNDTWIIAEKGKKVDEKRIIQLTEIPSLVEMYEYLKNFASSINGRGNVFDQDPAIKEVLNDNEFTQDLQAFIADYNQSAGDMGVASSYGEVLRNGQPTIVLTDYGLSDEVYDTHYSSNRKNNQPYRMYELYNFADGNDDILSDADGGMDIRQGMWAQMPYGVGDGDGNSVQNEGFVHFVSNRDKYPNIPMPAMPYLVEGFHNIVNNLKEILDNHKDKKGFYKNLLILQDYLIRQKFYDREPLALEEYQINKKEVLNEVSYDRKTADEIANEVAKIKGLSQPHYLGSGYFGVAYDIGDNQVLKITSDNSEAYENMELLGKPLQYIAKPYNVYQVKSASREIPKTYAIVLEKLKTDSSFEGRMKRLKYAFERILHESVGAVILTYVNGNNGYVDTDKVEKYLAKNPQDKEFFNALLNIAMELKKYGIESVEYTNADNLGYTKNGDIGLFDVGFTDFFLNPQPEEINLNEFGGDSLYSHTDNIGDDGFPTYNTNDTSPSIQNDLNANSAMYNEDLNYEHVSDATQDEYVISERIVSSMAGSSTVDVKKKCRLAGNGNTSTPCNQGDISNLNIKPLTEMNGSHPKDYWAWVSPDNRLIKVPTLKHKDYIMRIYKDAEFGWDYDRVFDQALLDGWVRAVYEYNVNNYSIELSLNGDTEERVKDAFRKIFADSVKYGRNYVYLEWEHPTRNHVKITTGDEEGRKQLSGLMTEEYLGTINYEDEDFKDPIEVFKNPNSIKNLKPHIRGVIDGKTGDLYIVNAINFLHSLLNSWLNDKFGFSFTTDFYQLYGNPFKIVPVQREGNTNIFKLGELYPSLYDDDDVKKLMPQIQRVLDMAKAKNPTIDFVPEVVPDSDVLLTEEIDASEAYSDDDSLQTVLDGKRNISGYVTYHKKYLIDKLEKTGLNIVPLVDNRSGLVIVYNNKGEENAMKLWKFATSKGGYFHDETPEEARFIGKMLEYSDDSIERFIDRVYDENGQRRAQPLKVAEGVGDKYAEKRFNMQPEFGDFEQQYRNKQSADAKDEIVYAGETDRNSILTIIKNPKSLMNLGKGVRGIIDREGNLYIEQKHSGVVHDYMLRILDRLGMVVYYRNWTTDLPTNFITVMRHEDDNLILLGESNEMMTPENERDSASYYTLGYWEDFPTLEEATPVFQSFLDKAKAKNPTINFVNENIVYYSSKMHESNLFETTIDGLENSVTFAAEIPVTNSTEMMNENEIMSLNDLPFKADVEAVDGKIHAVGGSVRDSFLGKDSKDLDILITGVPLDELERIIAKYGRADSVGKSFGVLKFMPNGMNLDEPIDIAIPRTETPTAGGGHKDFNVTSDHSLPIEKDLERRDITINAIAKDVNGNIIDPYGGQQDLKDKIIRAVNPQAFIDDPLRMLRCVGFASRFGFTIEPITMKMIQETAERIKEITPERILIEFDKIVKKGDKRIATQLLRDTGLFKNIFGFDIQQSTIDRSPFEDTHTMGEFLYLLTRLLPDPAIFYKTNLKGDIDTYKLIKALNMGLTNENENPIALRSVVYNMYGTSPKSLQSQILPTALRTAADELLSGKFPKTLGELAVNGNDLLEKGLQGSQIGQALKKMLLKVYSGKVANDKNALLALLANDDLDEAYGKRGEFDDFEKQFAAHQQATIEKPVGYVTDFHGTPTPIYKNPKSLANFDAEVRAIGNVNGDLFVALHDNTFTHGEISVALGQFSDKHGIYDNFDSWITLHRIGTTNSFGLAGSSDAFAEDNDARYLVDMIFTELKKTNPQFEFVNAFYNSEIGVDEGVGDKYAEKQFGIPDAGREFEDKYQRHRLVIDGEEPFGFVSDFIDWNGNTSPERVPVYKNPKSLIKFDYDVRAISDNQGNLYVALINEGFNHGEMAAHIDLVTNDHTIYDRISDFLLLHRVKDKDVFGFADSSEEEYNQSNEDRKRVMQLLDAVKRRNPQFKYIPKYYEEITSDENVTENLDETIKGGTYIMYHGSNHAFNKFTDEFVGSEEANDQEGAGIYFTTSEEEAGRYGKFIYKVELKPRKMTDVANKKVVSVSDITKLIKMSPTWKEDVQNWDENVMRGLAKAIKSLYDYSDNEKDLFQQIEHDFFRYESRLYVQGMTKLGFDGQLIGKDYEGIVHIIVYNPAIITILESNVEEEPQINEEMGRVLYSAIVLDNKSKQDLIKVFKPMIPKDWEILAHHVTINMGGIDPKYKRDLGRDIELSVIDYAMDDKVMAVGVEGYPTNNKKAHITVAVNRTAGGKPMMSNNLTDWKPLGFPLKLTGTVTEVKA